MQACQKVNGLRAWHDRIIFSQDAQKGRPTARET